jgi:uncharacterized protein (TIGR02001 family)
MTKRIVSLLAATSLSLGLAAAAHAEDAPSPTVAFNVAGTTNYEFRGVSQTDNKAALQGGADATLGLFYAGVWASNVKFAGDKADVEIDTYGGIRPTFGGVAFDFGAIHYGYLGEASGVQDDYWEFKGAASKAFGRFTPGVAVYYSPDFFAKTDTGWYYEVNGAFAVTPKLSISGAVGRQDVSYAGDYTTWNVGAAYTITDHASLDLRYWDTGSHHFGDIYWSRIVATLKGTF